MSAFIKITRPVLPDGQNEEAVRKGSLYCPTCLNLYALSASVAHPRPGVWMSDRGWKNAAEQGKGDDAAEPPPSWATLGRIDFACFSVHMPLPDIDTAAKTGCETCKMLQIVVDTLMKGTIPLNDPSFALYARFCKGAVLRLELNKVEEDIEGATGEGDEEDGYFASWGMLEQGLPSHQTMIAQFEVYTLPGMVFPVLKITGLVLF